MTRLALFTVASRQRQHHANALLASVVQSGYEGELFVVVPDAESNEPGYCSDLASRLTPENMGVPQFRRLLFRYAAFEAAGALKSFAMEHLLERGFEKVVYLDSDTYVYASLDPILGALDDHDGIIAPHITEPLDDGFVPDDLTIIRSGAYNTGFIAVRASDQAFRFLRWWMGKCEHQCFTDLEAGLFNEQKWADLIPSLFPGFLIDRSPGLNAAYWNLCQRPIEKRQGIYFVRDTRLVFFHFSGYYLEEPDILSVHDQRYRSKPIPEVVKELLADYSAELRRNGLERYKNVPYRYDFFTGTDIRIPPIVRKIYREDESIQNLFGDNPFDVSRDPGFLQSYNAPVNVRGFPLTRLSLEILRDGLILRSLFPEDARDSIEAFVRWFFAKGAAKYSLPDIFVRPIREALEARASSVDELSVGARSGRQHLQWLARLVSPVVNRLVVKSANVIRENQESVSSQGRRVPFLRRNFGRSVAAMGRVFRGTWKYCVSERAKIIVASHLHDLSARALLRARSRKSDGMAQIPRFGGIRVVGWLRSDLGLGESARSTLRAARAADISAELEDWPLPSVSRSNDTIAEGIPRPKRSEKLVNVFHVNIDHFCANYPKLELDCSSGVYDIGYWVWEMLDLPEEWENLFGLVDEVWTPSTFCQDIFSRVSARPVVRIPHNVAPELAPGMGRKELGLPEDRFIFMAAMDFLSTPERKNPIGTLDAYFQAFGSNPDGVSFLLKLSNSHLRPDIMEVIGRHCDQNASIIVMDSSIERQKFNALLNCCDCYVSLHRAEGFGLCIAEAMYFGKPAIATGWSGNMDFTNAHNSFPVRFTVEELQIDAPPYRKGWRWAEPDLSHAGELMRQVVENPDLADRIGKEGQKDIRTRFSPSATGKLMSARLDAIARNIGVGSWVRKADGDRRGR
jgi:glycosyltransferase involved in cell wall biosynthesis